jgi:hypothetical protein
MLIYEYTIRIPKDTSFNLQATEVERYKFVPLLAVSSQVSGYYKEFFTVYAKNNK